MPTHSVADYIALAKSPKCSDRRDRRRKHRRHEQRDPYSLSTLARELQEDGQVRFRKMHVAGHVMRRGAA
jgi:hypothetical protein